MKEQNKIGVFAATLVFSSIMNLMLIMSSSAAENPFDTTPLDSSYLVADGHKHAEDDQDKQKKDEHEQDKHAEHDQDKQKKDECNPDKGQNCNEPSW